MFFHCCSTWFYLLCGAVLAAIALIISFTKPKFKSIKGRHVVVTGGSQGIGKAVALLAVQRGASVTIVARNKDRLEAAVKELRRFVKDSSQQKVQYVSSDLASRDFDDKAFVDALEPLGPVYMIINCAGTSVPGKFEDIPVKSCYLMMDINYFGSINCTRAIIPQMKSVGEGAIVFVSSVAGMFGLYGFTAYSASKFAIRGFAEALEMELLPYGISVTVHCPPDTETPGFEEEEKFKPTETKIISQEAGLAKPEDVARTLLDDAQASKYLSTHGFDGKIIALLTAGTANGHFGQVLLEALAASPLRFIFWIYRQKFNGIVKRCKRARENEKKKE